MKSSYSITSSVVPMCFVAFAVAILFGAAAVCVHVFFPAYEPAPEVTETQEENVFQESEIEPFFEDVGMISMYSDEDVMLSMYRDEAARTAVEWFFTNVAGNREVALAILHEADKNDIPPALAFSLAYVESRYNIKAVNTNKNKSIDRGLFQLNSGSFPALTETDFFNPAISAKYGMSHLRFCLDTAGNEISALAMYNAGTGKVKANNTPQHTLNYIGQIMKCQYTLDRLFSEKVLSFYDNAMIYGGQIAYLGK